ncbi:E3 ubiquitin-protein ligase RING1-like [Andrographis paniculata]|uniref:E3 ubiquitin-protein ligase RING1-like n=1 Tax=Andrographis paniculata TaxID=175694 RepID=UPI0021E942B6|nr:E3 ubiquitin-protein ligase RING1-like [Andrographis paniculata]
MASAAAEPSGRRNVAASAAAVTNTSPLSPAANAGSNIRLYNCYMCHSPFSLNPYSMAAIDAAGGAFPCPWCAYRNLFPSRGVSPPPNPPPPPSSPPPSSPWPPNSGDTTDSDVTYVSSEESDSDDDTFVTDSEDESDLVSFFASLPIKIFPPNSAAPLPSCPICMEEFDINPDSSRPVNEVRCGHYFHKDCIVEWLQRRNTCPLCRCKVLRRQVENSGQGTNQAEPENSAHSTVDPNPLRDTASSGVRVGQNPGSSATSP